MENLRRVGDPIYFSGDRRTELHERYVFHNQFGAAAASLPQRVAIFFEAHNDMEVNRRDPCGDGDQSRLGSAELKELNHAVTYCEPPAFAFAAACRRGALDNMEAEIAAVRAQYPNDEAAESNVRAFVNRRAPFTRSPPVHGTVDYAEGTEDFAPMDCLIRAGADVNARNIFGYSVLYVAFTRYVGCPVGARSDRLLRTILRLVAAGADPNIVSRDGETILSFAFHRFGSISIVRGLLHFGADPRLLPPDVIIPAEKQAFIDRCMPAFGLQPGAAVTIEGIEAGDAQHRFNGRSGVIVVPESPSVDDFGQFCVRLDGEGAVVAPVHIAMEYIRPKPSS